MRLHVAERNGESGVPTPSPSRSTRDLTGHEADGRLEHECEPMLERAVYTVTANGHSRFQYTWLERARDGSLRRRRPS